MIPRNLLITAFALLLAALGMALYVRSMRAKVSSTELARPAQPVAPPATGPTEQATLYVAHDQDGTLRAQISQIPLPASRQQRSEELLRELITMYVEKGSPHPLGAGSDLRSVYLVDEGASAAGVAGTASSQQPEAEPGLAVIDLNGAFAEGHRSGILVESLTVASLIKTLKANIDGIHRVKILVEGKELDTLAGHVDLSNEFDADAVNRLNAELQPTE